jgi:hypothetical protein
MPSRSRSTLAIALQHRVLGVAFLARLLLFVGLTYAIFNKTFSSYEDVRLKTGGSPRYAERGRHAVPLGSCEKAIHGSYPQDRLPPRSLVPDIEDGVNYPIDKGRSATGFDVTSGYAGTASEQNVVDSLTARTFRTDVHPVPDLATLLFAPLARGVEVSLR